MTKRIRFGEPVEIELPKEMLPPEETIFGASDIIRQRRLEAFQVYICASTFRKIWKQLENSPNVETGGVLVGHAFRNLNDPSIIFVVIVDVIYQDSHNRSVGHYTVSPDENAAVRTTMESNYPGLVVVGWYHSHPGHGIFLSGQDMVIVRSIYNAEWHVALVVDPNHKPGKAGFFRGPEGEKLPGWLELAEIPTTVEAIQIYNQATEMLAQKQFDEAYKLLAKLVNMTALPPMLHWRRCGGYRNVSELLSQLPDNQTKFQSHQAAFFLDSIAESQNYLDRLKISDHYARGEQLLKRAFKEENDVTDQVNLVRQALQVFDWVQSNAPDYENTRNYRRLIKGFLNHIEVKRSLHSS